MIGPLFLQLLIFSCLETCARGASKCETRAQREQTHMFSTFYFKPTPIAQALSNQFYFFNFIFSYSENFVSFILDIIQTSIEMRVVS